MLAQQRAALVGADRGLEIELPALQALDDALDELARVDDRQSQIVVMRFFAGLTVEEIAAVLGVSTATVMRDWKLAKSWLLRELDRTNPEANP